MHPSQAALSSSIDPVLTTDAVAAKRKPLTDMLLRLARRPRPTPMPTPKPSKKAKAAAAAAADGDEDAPPSSLFDDEPPQSSAKEKTTPAKEKTAEKGKRKGTPVPTKKPMKLSADDIEKAHAAFEKNRAATAAAAEKAAAAAASRAAAAAAADEEEDGFSADDIGEWADDAADAFGEGGFDFEAAELDVEAEFSGVDEDASLQREEL